MRSQTWNPLPPPYPYFFLSEIHPNKEKPGASLRAQQVKNTHSMKETLEMQVWSLGQEDPLEEEMATHSSILAWKIPWREEPGRL